MDGCCVCYVDCYEVWLIGLGVCCRYVEFDEV